MTTLRTRLVPILSLVVCALLTGCGQSVQNTAAHKIVELLPREIGPAAHYTARVEASPFALARGHAKRVHIEGQQVQVSSALTLDTLTADAENVALDVKAKRLESVEKTDFVAEVGQENLEHYLRQTRPALMQRGLQIILCDTEVEARYPVSVGAAGTTVIVRGTLAPNPDNPTQVNFIVGSAQIGDIPVLPSAVGLGLRAINPVLDASHLRVPLAIRQVSIKQSQIVFSGEASLRNAPSVR